MIKKKILLINPPIYESRRDVFVNHPVGLLKVGRYFQNKGCKVKLFDFFEGFYGGFDLKLDTKINYYTKCMVCSSVVDEKKCGLGRGSIIKKRYHIGWPYSSLYSALKQLRNIDKIMVGSSMTYYWEGVHKVIDICKDIYPQVPVTVGGVYPTLCPEHIKKSRVDYICLGEFSPASNLFPEMGLLTNNKSDYAIVKTTRGCPNNCTYCAIGILEGRTIRHRNIDDVIKEIKLRIKSGVRKFVFWESNILFDAKEYLELLLDEIIKRKINISMGFPEGFDPRLIYPSLVEKLRLAGLRYVILSLESQSKYLQKRLNKHLDIDRFRVAVELFRKSGYISKKSSSQGLTNNILVFVLIGVPGQTLKSVIYTLIEVWKRGCIPWIMAFTPIPGTEEYKKCYRLIKNKGLEDLAPSLWPCANDELTAADLEEIMSLHGRHLSRNEIMGLTSNTKAVSLLKDLVCNDNH